MSETYAPEVEARLRVDAAAIVARYPDHPRSALGPMLHLVQSEDGFVSPRGVAMCADILGLTRSEVSAVATFYSQYRRHPNGTYNFGVCINPVCGVMGGDLIWEAVTERLGIGHDETTEDGTITLERLECNAACDYAPVVMVNWEFFDNQTPEGAVELVDTLMSGGRIHPTRGPEYVRTFTEVERVLAGFDDGLADEGPSAGPASLTGLKIARANRWTAPEGPRQEARPMTAEEAAPAHPAAQDAKENAAAKPTAEASPAATTKENAK